MKLYSLLANNFYKFLSFHISFSCTNESSLFLLPFTSALRKLIKSFISTLARTQKNSQAFIPLFLLLFESQSGVCNERSFVFCRLDKYNKLLWLDCLLCVFLGDEICCVLSYDCLLKS